MNIVARGRQYVVERRYTDFEELHKQVTADLLTCLKNWNVRTIVVMTLLVAELTVFMMGPVDGKGFRGSVTPICLC